MSTCWDCGELVLAGGGGAAWGAPDGLLALDAGAGACRAGRASQTHPCKSSRSLLGLHDVDRNAGA